MSHNVTSSSATGSTLSRNESTRLPNHWKSLICLLRKDRAQDHFFAATVRCRFLTFIFSEALLTGTGNCFVDLDRPGSLASTLFRNLTIPLAESAGVPQSIVSYLNLLFEFFEREVTIICLFCRAVRSLGKTVIPEGVGGCTENFRSILSCVHAVD